MSNSFGFQFYPGRRLPVVCRDGVTRSAVITGHGFLRITGRPGSVQVYAGGKRRTVTGLIRSINHPLTFAFHATGANAAFIPLTAHKPRLARAALRLIKATAYGRGAPGYIWDLPSDHSTALAGGCRLWFATSEWPAGGCQARAILKRLPPDLLPRLADYFDRLARFQLTPPPPPVE